LVDHDAQGILIAGGTRMVANLFGSHVEWRPCWLLRGERLERSLDDSQAKVAEDHLASGVEQQIGWLDIAVNDALLMGIIESGGDLLDIGHDLLKGELC